MGTNYYLYQKPPCPTCGHHADEPLHIGKSSHGWCFSLHVIPDRGLIKFEDWQRLIESPGVVIKDEYGDVIDSHAMLEAITNRKGNHSWDDRPIGYLSWDHFHEMNNSTFGPAGLLRHRIDGRYCIGHGEGTYDYLQGEFS